MSRTLETRPNAQRGETLVEFAVGLMLFLMILLGTMQLGILVFRYNVISDLAQEGARRASVCGANSGLSSTECDVVAFVQARSLGINPTVTVTPNPSTRIAGQTVQVQVQRTFNPFTRIVPLGAMTLSSTATMIVSR